MFISIKSKVSSTLMNTVTLAILILVRYDGYLGELEEVFTCTDILVGLGELFQHRAEGSERETEHDSEESESYILTMLNS